MAGTLIAFSGKGGSGKTTLAAMLVRELVRTGNTPVLAIDADPNATLAMALGASCPGTIADLRDEMFAVAQEPSGIPKDRLMDQWLAELLCEEIGYDLLTMGRPEGPRCYCYINGLLRRYLRLLRDSYPVVVVDCEAGMEYLSRLTVENVDTLVLTTEPTAVGLTTVRRIAALADALPIQVHRRVVAINKIADADAAAADAAAVDPSALPPAQAVVHIPFDEDIARCWAQGDPIDDTDQASRPAIAELARQCLNLSSQPTDQPQEEPTT